MTITDLDAHALSAAIHAREVSCRDVMQAYLDRIAAVNPAVNAIVSLQDGDALLRQADARDAQLARGQSLGWMHGESPASKLVDGDDKSDQWLASYRRNLGPGVDYRLNFFYADHRGENPGSTDDNEGYAITTSVRVAF